MTYIPSATKDFVAFTDASSASATKTATKIEAKPARGFLARMFDAVWSARQRQADIEIARYLSTSGGKLTDGAEREIERRLGSENFRLR